MPTRTESIEIRINELNDLLDQWEEHRLSARDPGEIFRSEKEISRIKYYLKQYDEELKGQGKKVVEDTENPITRPDIARVNRNWILSIIAVFLLLAIGFLSYQAITKVDPNYDKYLEYLRAGDQYIKDTSFIKAQYAYEKALEYFPADSAVQKKVDLLREANKMLADENFQEAKKLFSMILNVPAGSEVTFSNEHGPASNPGPDQMQIKLQWDGQNLIITITGGTPYANAESPYQIAGINCKDCVDWNKTNTGSHQAKINGAYMLNISVLSVQDSKGVAKSTQIPAQPETATGESSEPGEDSDLIEDAPQKVPKEVDPQIKEQQFKGLVESADQYFEEKKFVKAKEDYTAADRVKPGDLHVRNRIKTCEAEIKKELLKEAKQIARVSVPSGKFIMGTDVKGFPQDGPEHEVSLNNFKISKYEITVKQYQQFCSFTGRSMPSQPPYGWQDSNPITNVSWFDAVNYCEWVGGRLPTEAEWEYAAREGGGMADYSGGNQLSRIAIYNGNSNGMPKPVGSKSPNGFGIYDMTGNVAEWCNDWWNNKKYPAEAVSNPKGLDSGKFKIIRGGNYNSDPNSTQDGDALRTTYRNSDRPESRHEYLGFRVVW